ncbi:hypothetical protein [Eubacterium ramulus]|uniref:hypothetical protein n=1 Tax=Eubacterium ramulus TaxID=39490 RepID=UPI003520C8CC
MKQIEDAMDEKKMARIEAIIYSMTPAERGDPEPDQSKQKDVVLRLVPAWISAKSTDWSNSLSRHAR